MYSVCRAGGRVAATIPAPTSVGRRSAIIATFPSLFASLPEKIDMIPTRQTSTVRRMSVGHCFHVNVCIDSGSQLRGTAGAISGRCRSTDGVSGSLTLPHILTPELFTSLPTPRLGPLGE